jgi:hypothetical protein
MKQTMKTQARVLRKKGYSYSFIQKEIPVAKSTLSYWLADIPYTPNQETVLHIGKARAASGMAKNKLKIDSFKRAREDAKKDVGRLSKRDIFMLGLGLYAGEGTKTHDIVRLINANPKIIKFAILWFKEVCGLKNINFMVRIHLYPDNDINEALSYWSQAVGIPLAQFQQTQVDTRIGKKVSKRGKLPFGTAHLSIKSMGNKDFGVFLARKINAWIEEVF